MSKVTYEDIYELLPVIKSYIDRENLDIKKIIPENKTNYNRPLINKINNNKITSTRLENKNDLVIDKKWYYFHTPNVDGQYIWSDGNNVYSSKDGKQYVLNKNKHTWELKTWNGTNNISKENIWTDGENIYYSSGSNQKVLVSIPVQPSYQINTTSATQASVTKASTSIQKSEILGSTNQVIITPDVSTNGITVSIDSSLISGAAAGGTALQSSDISGLDTSDMNELLALIADDE